nr:MAG TPA: hypothetical protein [Caudoviricetes sp.]
MHMIQLVGYLSVCWLKRRHPYTYPYSTYYPDRLDQD